MAGGSWVSLLAWALPSDCHGFCSQLHAALGCADSPWEVRNQDELPLEILPALCSLLARRAWDPHRLLCSVTWFQGGEVVVVNLLEPKSQLNNF